MTKIAITGAAGRMGARLIALAKASGAFELVAAIERGDHPQLSHDAGEIAGIGRVGVPITSDLRAVPDVLIDFTAPPSMRHWIKTCRDQKIAMLIGTTGLTESDHALIEQTGRVIPILQAPNMSLGIAVLCRIAAEVTRLLGPEYNVEIVEAHHRFKKDAPSGTALAVADAIFGAAGKTRDALVYERRGDETQRKLGEVGMHSLRVGDEIGRHTAYFAAIGERLELTHVATNRDTFALGALRAAIWLATQKPGRYTISDVLGLK